MSVIVILIIASLIVAAGFLAAFLWSVSRGQYDDVETPAMRILFDDKGKKTAPQNTETEIHSTKKEE